MDLLILISLILLQDSGGLWDMPEIMTCFERANRGYLMAEVFFDASEIIVSKTDLKGRITYANALFCDVCGYTHKELIGQPHSIVRHPEMPRAVFYLLWQRIEAGQEIFAYVKNLTKHGDFYWVFAHITPSFDPAGKLVGYHSSRRVPDREVLTNTVEPLYRQLLEIEASVPNKKDGMHLSVDALSKVIADNAVSYDAFVFGLGPAA